MVLSNYVGAIVIFVAVRLAVPDFARFDGGDATSFRLGGGGLSFDQGAVIRSQHQIDRDRGDDQGEPHERKGRTVGRDQGTDDVRDCENDNDGDAHPARRCSGEHCQHRQAQPQSRQTQRGGDGSQGEAAEQSEDCPLQPCSPSRTQLSSNEDGQADGHGDDDRDRPSGRNSGVSRGRREEGAQMLVRRSSPWEV
ncbi:hypothetical protein, partial [Brevibacterium sp. VCM10]|uniref:hypothetical protein n=1 Tax=Brevibacterium sp. VCM10 TaxID=1381751 RepID=UPI0004714B48